MKELAFVALGSNLGDSVETVRRALDRLQTLTDQPLLKSSLWRSEPIDCPPGSPPFINAVAGMEPLHQETPSTLLQKLRQLEKEFGRQETSIRNAPRPLDLDLIAFGCRTMNTPELILPHPRAHLRRFVLQPLSEIAPDFILPGQTNTMRQLLTGLSDDENLVQITIDHG